MLFLKPYEKYFLVIISGIILLSGCQFFENKKTTDVIEEAPLVKTPDFLVDTAYSYVKKQVDFGPRTPNSKAHDACAAWMIATAKKYADTVYVQHFTATAFDGLQMKSTNIIASFNPEAKERILLSCHWDTRPIADQDEKDREKPIDGANDGGSGVGVLLEIARALSGYEPTFVGIDHVRKKQEHDPTFVPMDAVRKKPADSLAIGIDIIFFDSEDYGQPSDSKLPQKEHTYCLGSQYWAAHTHVPGYKALWGINLDMVGAADAQFTREQFSVQNADWLSRYVWRIGGRLGFGNLFLYDQTGGITDDHLYVMKGTNIPCIDIIDYASDGFNATWHTHDDNLQNISKVTMLAVGKTVLQSVYQYDFELKQPTK